MACDLQFLVNCFQCLLSLSSLSLSLFFPLKKDLYLNLFRAHISNPSCAKSNPFATLLLTRELMHNTFAPGCWLTRDRERYHCLRIIESTESIIVYRAREARLCIGNREKYRPEMHGIKQRPTTTQRRI